MFDSNVLDQEDALGIGQTDAANRSAETPEAEHSRRVREWTKILSNAPGWRGRLLRRALGSGWC